MLLELPLQFLELSCTHRQNNEEWNLHTALGIKGVEESLAIVSQDPQSTLWVEHGYEYVDSNNGLKLTQIL